MQKLSEGNEMVKSQFGGKGNISFEWLEWKIKIIVDGYNYSEHDSI